MFLVDLNEMLDSLRRRAVAAIAITFSVAALSYVASFLITPTYESSALVAISDGVAAGVSVSDAAASLATMVGVGLGPNASKKDELVATLRSYALIGSFIEKNDLLPVLFEADWDAEKSNWVSASREHTLQDGYELFLNEVFSINENRRTNLLTLSIRWRDRVQAADWLTRLIEQADAQQRSLALARTRSSISYLENAVSDSETVEMRQLTYRLIESHLQEEMLARVAESYAFRVVDSPVVADEDRYVSPRRSLIVAFFTMLSLGLCILWIVWPGLSRLKSRAAAA